MYISIIDADDGFAQPAFSKGLPEVLKIAEKNLSGHLTNKKDIREEDGREAKKENPELVFRDFQLYQALNVLTGLHKLNTQSRKNGE